MAKSVLRAENLTTAAKCGNKSNDCNNSAHRLKHKPKVHQLAENCDQSYSSDSEEEILSVTAENIANVVEKSNCKRKIVAHTKIEGASIETELDSGASCRFFNVKREIYYIYFWKT